MVWSSAFLGAIALLSSLLGVRATPTPGINGHDDHIPINKRTAPEVIAQLNLTANVEKGYYIQTFEDPAVVPGTNRSLSTAIYYLLEGSAGDSYWHRVDNVEVWHYYAGAPLSLTLSRDDGQPAKIVTLGPDVFSGQQPQYAIEKLEWQCARSWGDWTLVGTTGKQSIWFCPNGPVLTTEF
jgi:predicted cupin superfamily sugar epimerase